MKLYLVQHGQAKAKDEDPHRPLTPRGREDVEKVAAFLKPLRLGVRTVRHSGKTRAAQTAEILAAAMAVEEGVVQQDGLAPNDSVAPTAQMLSGMTDDLMIVGHMPFMAKLAATLLTGDEAAGCVAFQQGGVVCLERSGEAAWQVAWMIVPELLGS
jgi:phosphohistidine phosphatase